MNAVVSAGAAITTAVNYTATLSGTSANATVNTILGDTTGIVTATLTGDTAAAINTALSNGAATDALTMTLSAGTAAATDLTGLDGKSSVAIGAGAVSAINGTADEVNAVVSAGAAITTAVNYAATLSGTSANATVNTILGDTTGIVTATLTSDTAAAINTALSNGAATDALTITATNVSTDIADLIALNGKSSVDIAAGAVVTITSAATTTIDLTAAGVTWASGINVSGTAGADTITGTAGNDVIAAAAGDDKILAGAGDDTVTAVGTGTNIIRGGAGVDTLTGGTGNDTFVVLGVIGASDYLAADVTDTATGAKALGLETLIATGLATSDSGTNGAGETYAGGTGTNSLEIWGAANLSSATLTDIDAINTHSSLTISATQLNSLFASNGAAVTLNLLEDTSAVTITGATQAMGLSLLRSFTAGIDSTDTELLSGAPTITLDLFTIDQANATTYTIKPEDMFDLVQADGNNTLTDATGDQNSIMAADGTTITTVNANGGHDVIVVSAMSSSVTVNGGAGDDILVFADNNTGTTDLNLVTNVEIISLLDNGSTGASIVTVDSLVDNSVQGNGLSVVADNLTSGGLTFDGSAETDGYFRIQGSDKGDTITVGAKADFITLGDGADTVHIAAGTSISSSFDTITDFALGDGGANAEDKLDLQGTPVAVADGVVNGTNAGSILSHSVTNGIITFDDAETYAAALAINNTNISNVMTYLSTNFTAADNKVVAFLYDTTTTPDGADSTIVFQDNSATGATDSFILLSGITTGTSIVTADAANGILII